MGRIRRSSRRNPRITAFTKRESRMTSDHEVSRDGRHTRGGEPATFAANFDEAAAGALPIVVPGYERAGLQAILWEEFCEKFAKESFEFLP